MTSTASSVRPILFSAPMVRALLEGRKTQTRRILKPQPVAHPRDHYWLCPYGQPGDLLWVRETWANIALAGYTPVYFYRADGEDLPPRDARAADSTWRPSIHMPREASRLTLKIESVRVERLQDITELDAIAEGIERIDGPRGTAWKSYEVIHEGRHKGKAHPHAAVPNRSPVTSYLELWQSINGPGSWIANPWVWVLTFSVEKRNVGDVMRAAA